ncbi:MAG TPA: cytochrome P460 family protein [Thermodesulfovibrionales bacterium]|nr:cytochrome P460 family protein [Thermodesulfovibrionales bacterium]
MIMKKRFFSVAVPLTALLSVLSTGVLIAQDKYALKAPNGISFSEIRGYETWQVIAPSYRTEKKELRVILGNPIMIRAYKEGIPGNGKAFPEGSTIVKIGWSERTSAAFPAAIEPDVLQRVEFIVKDTKRFPDTHGWGYARFVYDAKTDTFSPYGKDASFAQECYQCHTLVKAKNFIFTGYPQR